MPKFRKKPVVIEAEQFGEDLPLPFDAHGVVQFGCTCPDNACCEKCNKFWVQTLEGSHIVSEGDWIIRGVKGEYYPCKPDIFAATYEPAE